MACRIQNLTKHRLALDLRGGDVIYLRPGELSHPLREELLYGNIHLPRWLSQGVVRKVDAKMADVLDHEKKAAAKVTPPAAGPAKAETAAVEAEAKEEPAEDASAERGDAEKPRPRGRSKDSGSKPDK